MVLITIPYKNFKCKHLFAYLREPNRFIIISQTTCPLKVLAENTQGLEILKNSKNAAPPKGQAGLYTFRAIRYNNFIHSPVIV